jgi:hypothetical protein
LRAKLATSVALVSAVAIFAGVFLLTGSLLWSPLVAAVGALGVYLMADARTTRQVESDTYAEDAERKVDEVLAQVREVRKLSRDVTSPGARSSLESACQYVPELLDRVRANSPNSLYSSASQIGAHVASLAGVVRQYLDIQRKPSFYRDPDALKLSGDDAFRRFTEFAFESVQLVNQGDIATYRANLETVAPPRLPDLS